MALDSLGTNLCSTPQSCMKDLGSQPKLHAYPQVGAAHLLETTIRMVQPLFRTQNGLIQGQGTRAAALRRIQWWWQIGVTQGQGSCLESTFPRSWGGRQGLLEGLVQEPGRGCMK
jgi:hypothetical protein